MIEQIEEKTLKQLKEDLVKLGMPEDQVNTFNTKGQIQAVINTLKATEVVKKVDSLEEKESPVEKRQSEKQWRSKAEQMKAKLMAQPMVRTILPLNPEEKPGVVEWRTDKKGEKYQFVVSGSFETVQLNGFKWIIPKGTPTNVPEQVSEILDASYLKTMKAGENISLNRVDERTGKPMNELL